MGKVSTQAMTIDRATPQRTAERRLVAPTPITAEVMVWVVEIGASIDVRRGVEHRGRDRLGGEAAGGVEVDDPAAEGAHDPPAAGPGAERDRGGGREDHPERQAVAVGDVPAGQQRQEDHAHRLLRVLEAVARAPSRRPRRSGRAGSRGWPCAGSAAGRST